MSGLLHLVEAATALTQLVAPTNNRSPSSVASMQSTSPLPTNTMAINSGLPYYPRKMMVSTHSISDNDDDTMASNKNAAAIAHAKMAALRENHLQALRAAVSNAMATPAPPPTQLAPASYSMNTMNQATVSLAGVPSPAPTVAVMAATPAPEAQAPLPQQVVTTTNTTSRIVSRSSSNGSTSNNNDNSSSSKEMFPMRLHSLLADPSVRDVISWLPHGKSFVVLRPDVFATRVLPRYFAPEGSNSLNAKISLSTVLAPKSRRTSSSQGVHKYPSFTRKLNRWGFRQISRGPDAGAFCHELFQRDCPLESRGMVCQKSRKSKSKAAMMMVGPNGSVLQDDMMSVSSASTMGTKLSVASGDMKRPFSSTVTVSTAGVNSSGTSTSNKSLPFKKRKSGQHITNNNNNNHNNTNNQSYMHMNDIPSMISHRQQKMPTSTSSVTESDLTSDNGSVCSSNVANATVNVSAVNTPVPKASANAAVAAVNNAAQAAEAAAREALARHFHEQHRAFALASLMENSRLAIEAANVKAQQQTVVGASSSMVAASQTSLHQSITNDNAAVGSSHKCLPVLGAMTTHSPAVFAPTVYQAPQAATISSAEAAKSALYQAYLQALSSNASS